MLTLHLVSANLVAIVVLLSVAGPRSATQSHAHHRRENRWGGGGAGRTGIRYGEPESLHEGACYMVNRNRQTRRRV